MREAPAMSGRSPMLVVEADGDLGRRLVDQLVTDEHPAKLALSATHASVLANREPPALVVLGTLDSPTGALTLLRAIRGSGPDDPWHPDVPVIVLGPNAEEPDLLRAFEAGADDFLAHPPSYLELRARLRAVVRRTTSPRSARVLRVGPLTIDTAAHAVSLHGRLVDLRSMEYNLLIHLADDPSRVFGKHELLRVVWGYREPGHTRTLDSHASRLRCKLTADGERWVINLRGVGYRLV